MHAAVGSVDDHSKCPGARSLSVLDHWACFGPPPLCTILNSERFIARPPCYKNIIELRESPRPREFPTINPEKLRGRRVFEHSQFPRARSGRVFEHSPPSSVRRRRALDHSECSSAREVPDADHKKARTAEHCLANLPKHLGSRPSCTA